MSQPIAGSARPLSGNATAPAQVQFSPDGSRVAMVLSGEGNPEVYVGNAQGRQIRRLTGEVDEKRAALLKSSGIEASLVAMLGSTDNRDSRPKPPRHRPDTAHTMTITAANILLIESERMTDTDDGGGRRTATVIPDGVQGNIFPKVSRADATAGRVNLRKVYGHVDVDTVETYAGAHAIITKPPTNAKISALRRDLESMRMQLETKDKELRAVKSTQQTQPKRETRNKAELTVR